MDMRRFTTKAQEALSSAQTLATREGHPALGPEHLLVAMLRQEGGVVPRVLARMGIRGEGAWGWGARGSASRTRPDHPAGAGPFPLHNIHTGAASA